MDEAKDQIIDLEDKIEKNSSIRTYKKHSYKAGKKPWDYMTCNNIHSMYVPEEENKHGMENLFEEIMSENFPNVGKENVTQVQKAQSPKQNKNK